MSLFAPDLVDSNLKSKVTPEANDWISYLTTMAPTEVKDDLCQRGQTKVIP